MNKIPIENFIDSFERNLLGSGLDYFIKPEIYVKRCFFENYFNDIEHGFFHAFCCCLVSYLINNYDFDNRLISSLLLHDFLKCNGFSQEDHDVELEKYYPNLLKETYSHSNPPDDKKILIMCDRLELQRYPDYKEWVDTRFLDILNSVSKHKSEEIEIFYREVRPVLLFYYEKRHVYQFTSSIIMTDVIRKFYNVIEKTREILESINNNQKFRNNTIS
jgi:hypothetical protein